MELAEFLDDNVYEIECSKNHRSITILQEQKFEILFEIGAYAILDGYYREAVTSFTSSLERFYGFFIRASLSQSDIAREAILDAWKLVAAQSERQFGAFIFLYVSHVGSSPPALSNDEIAFRNSVIHKGKIPNRAEASWFGNSVLKIIRHGVEVARTKFPSGFNQTMLEPLQNAARKAAKMQLPTATCSIGTVIGLTVGDPEHHNRDLDEAIGKLPRWHHGINR